MYQKEIISLDSFVKLLALHPNDNVVVALGKIGDGEQLDFAGQTSIMKGNVSLGHKVACKEIKEGEKILKYGVSIGSATKDITMGEHVHVHNIKSDYTSTHVLEETQAGEN